MKATSAIAIYFIIWWLVLFLVLPFGVKNAAEQGEAVQAGNEAGAPVNPRLVRKVLYTTILATIVFGLVYGTITRGWITLDTFSFLGRFEARD
jgi:predicted secreted protein